MTPIKIAFYGKGGIGKSTISSNVSAMLAKLGKRVLHIGCDPKADSTLGILGKRVPTVLEVLGEKENPVREDLLHQGIYGVNCVEAGGPEAGSGCAGLGIITAIEQLEQLNIFDEKWDVIVYDVLGDVVCGGFSVPMRKHYVDQVYVVTSSDFMSLYGANNILKGITHYSSDERNLFGGLILNHIKSDMEIDICEKFAEMTHTNIAMMIQESSKIKASDYQRIPLVSNYPEDDNSDRIKRFTDAVLTKQHPVTQPTPMSKDELEDFREKIIVDGYFNQL